MSSFRQGRRRCVASFMLAPLVAGLARTGHAQTGGVAGDQVVLGHSGDLTGPLRDLGQQVIQGSQLYFDALNAAGGIHGRKVRLLARDDGYEPQRTLQNVNAYIENDEAFALFGVFGTPNNEAIIPAARSAGLPVIGSYTGATSIRGAQLRGVYNIRASYADETEKLVEHITTLNMRRVAVAHQDNNFGREVLAAAVAALGRRGLQPLVVAAVKNDASDAAAAAQAVAAANPDAVLLGLAGKPTVETIRQLNQRRRGLALYAPSVLAAPSSLRELGKDATGVAVTQIVPSPFNTKSAVVREYQAACLGAGLKEFSHLGLEGFVNAKVAAEGLRRAGRHLTRAGFMAGLESMRRFDVGGMDVSFGQGAASGSRLVELTMISADGRMIR